MWSPAGDVSREGLGGGERVGELVGGDGERRGGVSSVDVLAFEQLLGDERGLGEPAGVALAVVAVDRAGERLARVGAHVADEHGLGIAWRTVEQLVGEEEPGWGGGGDVSTAVGDRLELYVVLEPAARRIHPRCGDDTSCAGRGVDGRRARRGPYG